MAEILFFFSFLISVWTQEPISEGGTLEAGSAVIGMQVRRVPHFIALRFVVELGCGRGKGVAL